jgi:hypothetical protein
MINQEEKSQAKEGQGHAYLETGGYLAVVLRHNLLLWLNCRRPGRGLQK